MTACMATIMVAGTAMHAVDASFPETATTGGPGDDEPPLANALLLGVIQQLPPDPIRVTGELLVRKRRGVPVAVYGFELIARWGAMIPQSQYTIRDAFGRTIEQLTLSHGKSPIFHYAAGDPLVPAPIHSLGKPVQESDITWMDLTLSFLWWTDASHETEESIRGFDCYVIHVNAPPDQAGPYKSVRLWISKKAGMMLQAEGLNAEGQPVRQLWVRSVKKVNDAWMIKDMEIQKVPPVQRTKLHIAEVELLEP